MSATPETSEPAFHAYTSERAFFAFEETED
jgi:hypothetical protein